jgi:hypothetical protein
MLYRPALHGKSNALSLARRALKDKLTTPVVPLTTALQNRQVFLPDPVKDNKFLKVRIIRDAVTFNLFLLAAVQGDWNCL